MGLLCSAHMDVHLTAGIADWPGCNATREPLAVYDRETILAQRCRGQCALSLVSSATAFNPVSLHSCRDMFVDINMRPQLSGFRRGMLDALMDETDQVTSYILHILLYELGNSLLQPTQEMFEKAYEFRKMRLQKLCFE